MESKLDGRITELESRVDTQIGELRSHYNPKAQSSTKDLAEAWESSGEAVALPGFLGADSRILFQINTMALW